MLNVFNLSEGYSGYYSIENVVPLCFRRAGQEGCGAGWKGGRTWDENGPGENLRNGRSSLGTIFLYIFRWGEESCRNFLPSSGCLLDIKIDQFLRRFS